MRLTHGFLAAYLGINLTWMRDPVSPFLFVYYLNSNSPDFSAIKIVHDPKPYHEDAGLACNTYISESFVPSLAG